MLAAAGSLQVVYCMTWPYDAPVDRLADGARHRARATACTRASAAPPRRCWCRTRPRPSWPATCDVAVICGAEALDTRRRAQKAGERLPWSHREPDPPPFPFEAPFHPAEVAHEVFQAWLTFPVFDVARRARLGVAPADYAGADRPAAGPVQRGGRGQPLRLVPGRGPRRGAGHAHPGQPPGRLPVHEARGLGHGRRHGRRRHRGQPRRRRRARRPRRAAGLPAGLVLRHRPRLRGRAPRPVRLAGHGRRRGRGPAGRGPGPRRRGPPRPVQLLRQLGPPGLRRPGPGDRRRPGPHGHRRPAVRGRRRQQLRAPQPRDHGRGAAGRSRLGGAGHRRRHAHDQARLRPLLDRAAAGRPGGPARRGRGPGPPGRGPAGRPSRSATRARPRWRRTRWPTGATAPPSGAWCWPTSPRACGPTAGSRTRRCWRRWRPRSGWAGR